MEPRDPLVFSFDSPDPESTFAQAALLGRAIGARGLAIGLIGPLGAGKTVFVKGLASGLGVDAALVSSPTFVIAQQYFVPEGPERPDGPEALHHLDLYRLGSEAELEGIGFLDWLGFGQVLAVEWLDRFPGVLGEERLEIELLPTVSADAGGRRLRASAWGDEPTRVLRDWADRLARLEREAGDAGRVGVVGGNAGGRPRGDAVVALLLGLVGLRGLLGLLGDPDPSTASGVRSEPACERMRPAATGETAEMSALEDGLGPLRVVCVDAVGARRAEATSGESGQGASLSGMALLLDGGRVDVNRASRALLENLPGIGAGRATAILEERARAPFASLRDLERVSGIGPRLREGLEPWLQVDSTGPPG